MEFNGVYVDLELMRKANISGIAVDGNGISLSQTVGTEINRYLSEMVIFLPNYNCFAILIIDIFCGAGEPKTPFGVKRIRPLRVVSCA